MLTILRALFLLVLTKRILPASQSSQGFLIRKALHPFGKESSPLWLGLLVILLRQGAEGRESSSVISPRRRAGHLLLGWPEHPILAMKELFDFLVWEYGLVIALRAG